MSGGATGRASEAQLAYLDGLLAPDRLARLTCKEARFLISWLRGPPQNQTRSQQVYIADLVAALPSADVRTLIESLRKSTGQGEAPPALPPVEVA